ncbi:MAG: hypothetical protein JO117_05955 [Verrucomicrobia bacterium]|nr:hypothetical protein [Verrucomicrobiota bacterium]
MELSPLPPRAKAPAAERPLLIPLLWLFALLPAFLLLLNVIHNWVNVPFSDEWDMSLGVPLAKFREGTLTFASLWTPITESRPVFPRLLALALLGRNPAEWDLRRGMLANLAVVGLISAAFFRLLGTTSRPRQNGADATSPAGLSLTARLGALVCINLLLFSPVQWEIWLLGEGQMVLLPLLALALALLVNLSALPLVAKAGLNSALAFFGTFSFANGLLLWPLVVPLEIGGGEPAAGGRASRRDRIVAWALYALVGVASIGFYFRGYRSNEPNPLPFVLRHTEKTAEFFLRWCASPLVKEPAGAAIWLGLALVAGFVGAVIWLVLRQRVAASAEDRVPVARGAYPWCVLGVYTLVSGALAAVGRVRHGVELAASSRYAAHADVLLVAEIALLTWFFFGWRRQRSGGFSSWFVVAPLAFVFIVLQSHAAAPAIVDMRDVHDAREKARQALRYIDVIPDNPQLRALFPADSLPILRKDCHRLLDARLLHLPPLAPARLAEAFHAPTAAGDVGTGAFDLCQPRPPELLVVSGWTRDPRTGRGADVIVFTCTDIDKNGQLSNKTRPFTLAWPHEPRPDVVAALGGDEKLATSGFSEAIYKANLKAPRGRIAAWIVDPATGEVWQLPNYHDVQLSP